MHIVTAVTFLAMPAGTVFAKLIPSGFGELMVKGETSEQGTDFYYVSPTDQVDDLGIFPFEHEIHLEDGTPVPLSFNTVMRDGLKDMSQVYAVWERKDVEGLVSRLQLALHDGYPATPDEPCPRAIEVWAAGYSMPGYGSRAELLGTYQASTFDEAVEQHLLSLEDVFRSFYGKKDDGGWRWWCGGFPRRLHDNEADARKNFG